MSSAYIGIDVKTGMDATFGHIDSKFIHRIARLVGRLTNYKE
jgi:hypothetical protein